MMFRKIHVRYMQNVQLPYMPVGYFLNIVRYGASLFAYHEDEARNDPSEVYFATNIVFF